MSEHTAWQDRPDSLSGVAAAGHGARQVRDLLLVLLAGLALLTAGTAGYGLATAERPATPTTDSVEAGFARDMSVHHAQAVQMSLIAHDATDDPAVRYMTYDIATGQQAQIGTMSGWLTEWGLNQTDTSQTRMAWMSAGHHRMVHGQVADAGPPVADGSAGATGLLPDGRMPGMASADDVARLRALRGTDAEVLWLRLMVAHHRGGVDMARAALALSDRPAVRQLAQSIVDSQTAEIEAMQAMLRDRGQGPA